MVSRVRIQADCDEQLDEESQERMGQLLLSFFQRHSSSESGSSEEEIQEADEEGREGGEEADEEEYAEGGRLLQVHEEESSPSINSPSQFRSWNYSDHHEVADDSEQLPTAPSQPILPSESSNQDRGLFSPAINSSMVRFFFSFYYTFHGELGIQIPNLLPKISHFWVYREWS